MPDFLDTTNLSVHQSISEQQAAPTFEAITRSQAASWSAIPLKYRKRPDKEVVEMDAAEKAVVDAAEKQTTEDRRLAELSMESVVSAASLVLLDEINALRTRAGLVARTIQQFKDAVRA